MTKKMKTRRLAAELGIDKADAADLLRRSGWDMNRARELEYLRRVDVQKAIRAFGSIDWDEVCKYIGEAIERMGKAMSDALDACAEILSKRQKIDTEENDNETPR